MSVEVLTFRLEARGGPAGRQVLRTDASDRNVRLECEARFEGPLPRAEVVQLSRCRPEDGVSYAFQERTRDRNGTRGFRIDLDGRAGLIRFTPSDGDPAEAPAIEEVRDPLSLLRELRRTGPEVQRIRLPMLGKTVEARAVGETDLETDLGPKRARAFLLHPGGAWVWIDVAPPHAVLKLAQRTVEGRVDALLSSIAQEASMPLWEELDDGRKGSSRRRKRRRRGRGGRARSGKGGRGGERAGGGRGGGRSGAGGGGGGDDG